jgi:hypothetical protein
LEAKRKSPEQKKEISMNESIAQASNIANVIVAFANILLVLFLFWQITLQKRFFIQQSQRDASQKVSESYQRLSATFLNDKDLAALFYQADDPAEGQIRAAWSFVLNTLQHEYRFAKQGLHPMQNVEQTAKGYIGFIKDSKVLKLITGVMLKTGYDAGFASLITEIAGNRLIELERANIKPTESERVIGHASS